MTISRLQIALVILAVDVILLVETSVNHVLLTVLAILAAVLALAP